jgi:hypothetical protein
VLAGVLLSGIFFAGKVRKMFAVERDRLRTVGRATYRVTGRSSSPRSIASPVPSAEDGASMS